MTRQRHRRCGIASGQGGLGLGAVDRCLGRLVGHREQPGFEVHRQHVLAEDELAGDLDAARAEDVAVLADDLGEAGRIFARRLSEASPAGVFCIRPRYDV